MTMKSQEMHDLIDSDDSTSEIVRLTGKVRGISKNIFTTYNENNTPSSYSYSYYKNIIYKIFFMCLFIYLMNMVYEDYCKCSLLDSLTAVYNSIEDNIAKYHQNNNYSTKYELIDYYY